MVDLLKDFNEKKFLYKDETYKVIGACMEVHKILGKGLLEVVYKDAMEIEFGAKSIPYQREKKFEIKYKDVLLNHCFYSDFVAFDKIIVEIKAQKNGIGEENEKQLINYLAIAKFKVGLLINFGEDSLVYKRIAL